MSKLLFAIYDSGGYTKITGCRIEEDTFPTDPSKFREVTNAQLFYLVRDMLHTKDVKFESNIATLTQNDLIIEGVDEVEKFRLIQMARMRNSLNSRIDVFTIFDFFNYSVNANKLAAAGYFISDANREDKYLEIVNSGDDDLISALEAYLASYDRVKVLATIKSMMDEVVDEIREMEDPLAIQDRVNQFLDSFE